MYDRKMPKWSISKYHSCLYDIYEIQALQLHMWPHICQESTIYWTLINELNQCKTWTLKYNCTSIHLWYPAFLHRAASLKIFNYTHCLCDIFTDKHGEKSSYCLLLYKSKLRPKAGHWHHTSTNKAKVKVTPASLLLRSLMPTLLNRSFSFYT